MAKNKRKESREGVPAAKNGPGALSGKERVPSWILWPVCAAWVFFVFRNYYSHFPVNFNLLSVILSPGQYTEGLLGTLPGHFLNLTLSAAFLFVSFSLGRPVLRSSGFKYANWLEEAVFSIGAGFGLLAAFVFLAGIFKLLYFWTVAAPMALIFAAGIADLVGHPFTGEQTPPPSALGAADLAALSALLLAMLLNLAGALAPEIFYDALVYHLAVPNFFAISHKIAQMPYNFFSNLPLTHGMLFTAALLLKDEILAKLINYWAGVLTAAVVLAIGIRYFSWRAGLWGALIFYTVFHFMIASWSAGTEALLTFFSTLAVYAVLNSSDEGSRLPRPSGPKTGAAAGKAVSQAEPCVPNGRGWLWLAAVFTGLAMGVKYTGILSALGVMAAYAFHARAKPFSVLKNLAAFTLVASLVVGPWLVKNYIYKGNPVYPFMLGVFSPDAQSDVQKLKGFGASQVGATASVGDWLMTPWKITMGEVGNSEYFSPLFLLLLPLTFMLGVRGPKTGDTAPAGAALQGLWLYFLTVWVCWSFTSTMVRMLMPAYPAAGLIMAACVFSPAHRGLKSALKAAILAACLTGIFWSGVIFYTQGRWRPLTGSVSKDDYLSHTHPSFPYSSYAALKFINEKLPSDAKVLMIGDERSFYLKKKFIVSSVYDKTAIVEYASASKDGDEMFARLRADGVTHLLLNVVEAIRIGKDYKVFYFTPSSQAVFNDLWSRHVKETYYNDETDQGRFVNRVGVYELVPQRDAVAPVPYNFLSEVILKNIAAK
jgi:4-amino-4-deoxy-L-arabinose transferase-like glycosyltransferase